MIEEQGSPPPCFLCRERNPAVSRTLTGKQILAAWALAGVRFSERAVGVLQLGDEVHLFRCRRCGFEFFDPALAAPAQFYSELQAKLPGYYSPARPENERNARFARDYHFENILDIGCGTGCALNHAREQGLSTYGIELNSDAAALARARGHTIFSCRLEELGTEWQGRFDLIYINQLLEHLPDPVAFVKSCIRFLSPRGVIAITVPGSRGVLRFHPWLAANWPPHHLSRWRRQDLVCLSKRCDLRVIRTGGNQLFGGDLKENLLDSRAHFLALGKNYCGPNPATIKALAFLYSKTGMKLLFRSQGHSIFCFLARKNQGFT